MTRRRGVVHAAWSLAHIFGIEERQVRVTSPYVGGAFGGKLLWQHQVLAAAAAKLADRPVRLTLTREGVHRAVGGRALTEQRVWPRRSVSWWPHCSSSPVTTPRWRG